MNEATDNRIIVLAEHKLEIGENGLTTRWPLLTKSSLSEGLVKGAAMSTHFRHALELVNCE